MAGFSMVRRSLVLVLSEVEGFMKVGFTLLAAAIFLAQAGTTNLTFATTNDQSPVLTSSCLNSLISTKLCEEFEKQTCLEPVKVPENSTFGGADVTFVAEDSVILDSNKIFDLVNQYRSSLALTSFEEDTNVCDLAQTRSAEIISETQNGTLHSGLYNRGLPYWIFENAKYGASEEGTVAWWSASPLHRASILGDYKFSCVRCTGSACVQLFTSFSPR